MCALTMKEIELYCVASAILRVVEARADGATLDALQGIPGFAGDADFRLPRANVTFFKGISPTARRAISTLCAADIVRPVPCAASEYSTRPEVANWQPIRLVLSPDEKRAKARDFAGDVSRHF